MAGDLTQILLAVNIGTLAAVVYALRVIVKTEEKINRLMEQKGMKWLTKVSFVN